jgi:hypothetical protein
MLLHALSCAGRRKSSQRYAVLREGCCGWLGGLAGSWVCAGEVVGEIRNLTGVVDGGAFVHRHLVGEVDEAALTRLPNML